MVKVVKVTMNDELYRCFLKVKKHIGIESDADVLRFLIKNYCNTHFPGEDTLP
jgi:negative regulator of replication initiation